MSMRPRPGGPAAVPVTPRTALVLAVASLAGLMMLGWPLLLRVPDHARVDPPFLFLALLPIVIAVMLAESPAFAPQVTKVLGAPWLRVDEVVAAWADR